jgi:hypothetical protein
LSLFAFGPRLGAPLDHSRADALLNRCTRALLLKITLDAIHLLRRDGAHVILDVGHSNRLEQGNNSFVVQPKIACDLVNARFATHRTSIEPLTTERCAGSGTTAQSTACAKARPNPRSQIPTTANSAR